MAAGIEWNDQMFSVRETPWHKLGKVIPDYATSKEAIEIAEMGYRVELQPIFARNGNGDLVSVTDAIGRRATVRINDDGTESILGVVGKIYTPIQNDELARFMDALLATGKAVYDTGGTLDGGKTAWFLARLAECDVKIAGTDDVTNMWALGTNTHDGSRALRLAIVAERVVCRNTLNIAIDGARSMYSIFHLKNWQDHLTAAREALGIIVDYSKAFQTLADTFSHTPFAEQEMKTLAEILYPGKTKAGEVSPQASNLRELVLATYHNEGDRSPATAGTAWAALNAVGEVADWKKTDRNANSLAKSTVFGGSIMEIKHKAAKEIVKMAGITDVKIGRMPMQWNPENGEE